MKTGSSENSREHLMIHAFDGRIVTRISVGTQTNWSHDEECTQEHEKQRLRDMRSSTIAPFESVPKNMKSELKISPENEVLDSPSKETPQTPAACQGETGESLTNVDKIPASSGSDSEEPLQTVLNICCEHCQQLKKPPVTSDQIANSTDPKEFFCCERAWRLSEIWLKGAAVTTGETVTDEDAAMQRDQSRLTDLESVRSSYRQTSAAGHKRLFATLHEQLSDDAESFHNVNFLEMQVVDSENSFSLNRKTGQKRTTPLLKNYKNGQTFILIFPDGTGQVCYPSGRLAILVSATQSADWSCVLILEDKVQPNINALFTTGGRGTCYHNNGCVWVNLTPQGGTYCSDTGDLKKHWFWLDEKHHDHVPPWQPLCLTLSPNLNIRIKSQQHICITFTSGKHSVQLSVGATLKLNEGKGLMLPGPDMLQRNLQQKSAEINVLLENIQSLITYQKTVGPRKVKPQQSLISQMERRRQPMKQQQPAKKTP